MPTSQYCIVVIMLGSESYCIHAWAQMKARGVTLLYGQVQDYNRFICRAKLATANKTCDLSHPVSAGLQVD